MKNRFATISVLLLTAVLWLATSCNRVRSQEQALDANNHVALELNVPGAYRFVAFGDTRFHDPADTEVANPAVRKALVEAIDKVRPAFVSIGGDIVYDGEKAKDWEVWDSETATWKLDNVQIYPALGNHDLKGKQATALTNYFARFPELKESRYYSVKLGKNVMLVMDSALDELTGPQGDWLKDQFNKLPDDANFVFMVFHHPPYTSSSDDKAFGGGHTARESEKALGKWLEGRQQNMRARIIVFNGHVHNYERHEYNGVTYFVTGGGGAHAYPIPRGPDDLYKDNGINYHYLLIEVDGTRAQITMNKLEIVDGKAVWTKPDQVVINASAKANAAAH
ncbi:MAG: metallophosphoesterase [Candidatus Acidiferrum sp.]